MMSFLWITEIVTFTVGVAAYLTTAEAIPFDYVVYASFALLVAFSFVAGVKRLKDQRKGLAVDDELSQQIRQKAASHAFIASFFLWSMILVITVNSAA